MPLYASLRFVEPITEKLIVKVVPGAMRVNTT